MKALAGKVAVVTGASRGLGKGIALGLGEAGATVYITGRSTREVPGVVAGDIDSTADEVTRLGGRGIAARCDHRVDAEMEALVERVRREQGAIDLLVNNALASPPVNVLWGAERFWRLPVSLWDDLIDVGLRSHFVASRLVAPLMIERGRGLIINVASHAADRPKTQKSRVILPYSVGKAGLHRLSSDMAVELREHNVAVVEVWPPASVTEHVMAKPEIFGDLSQWKQPILTGRVVAALAAESDPMARSGQALPIDDLARELGVGAGGPA
jgi:dehydrogenase/reductase SDR family protein 1